MSWVKWFTAFWLTDTQHYSRWVLFSKIYQHSAWSESNGCLPPQLHAPCFFWFTNRCTVAIITLTTMESNDIVTMVHSSIWRLTALSPAVPTSEFCITSSCRPCFPTELKTSFVYYTGWRKKRPEHLHALFSQVVAVNQHNNIYLMTKNQRICVGIFAQNTSVLAVIQIK